MGAAARLPHRPGDPGELQRRAAGRHRLPLPGAAPARAAEADRGRLEAVGEQAAHPRLPADRGRAAAAALRTVEMGSARRGDRRHPQRGETEGGIMTRRRDKDRELDEELRTHLAMATRDRIERGEDPAQAAAAARREFGNVAQVQEVTREMWGWTWLERLAQDVRYAVRLLAAAPAFSIVAIVSLAVAIGANAAIFQVNNAVRLRVLPVARAHELVEITPVSMEGARGNFSHWRQGVSNPIWEQIHDHQEAFSG